MSKSIASWLADVLPQPSDLDVCSASEERIRRAYAEYLRGYTIDPHSLIVIVSDDYSGSAVVEQRDIPFYSMCAHHFLPFFGTVNIRYVPTTKLIGIGKLPRLVECFASRLTMQETIVKELGDFLKVQLAATLVEVGAEARHLCVEARGPRSQHSVTRTSYIAK